MLVMRRVDVQWSAPLSLFLHFEVQYQCSVIVVITCTTRMLKIMKRGVGGIVQQSSFTLSVHVGELESLDQSQRLIDRATDREIIDGHLTQMTLAVNDEQAQMNLSWSN